MSPIPVELVVFHRPQFGLGASTADVLRHRKDSKTKGHEIEFRRDLNAFLVRYYADATASPVETVVERTVVDRWKPRGPLPAPPQRKPGAKG